MSCYFFLCVPFCPCITHAVTAIASFYIMTSVKDAVTTDSYLRYGYSLHSKNKWAVLSTFLLYLLVNVDE